MLFCLKNCLYLAFDFKNMLSSMKFLTLLKQCNDLIDVWLVDWSAHRRSAGWLVG
jgi:hypothetical protein